MSEGAPFPMLRAAWLRIIARVWNDPTGKLLQELIEASRKDPRGILPILEHDFHFKFPFPRVKLTVDDRRRPRWMPVGTRGWFGFADEFKLALPGKPAEKDEAELLGEYLQEFPTMLGAGTLAEAPEDFASFGLITGRVIALAWRDLGFHDALFATDDARNLVQDAMDVVIPWNFRLKFTEHKVLARHGGPPHASDVGARLLSTEVFEFGNYPLTEICINMPEPPDKTQSAVALAAYNDTGRQYPFTCG
jgi:ribosomally synthesized peptide (two-chain TOMM family)